MTTAHDHDRTGGSPARSARMKLNVARQTQTRLHRIWRAEPTAENLAALREQDDRVAELRAAAEAWDD